jgi:hypothetical protein
VGWGRQPNDRIVQANSTLLLRCSGVTIPDRLRFSKDHPAGFEASDFSALDPWLARAAELKAQARRALGFQNMPARSRPTTWTGTCVRRDGYSVRPFQIDGSPGLHITGSLYQPDRQTNVVLLHPHGHYAGGRLQRRTDAEADRDIDSGGESDRVAATFPLQVACATLARMGCTVVQYDLFGFGERSMFDHRAALATPACFNRGITPATLQTWAGLRALDWVLASSRSGHCNVGVVGQSGGATQAMLLGLIDERPGWFFLAGMIGMAMQGGCVCENAPGLRVNTNNVELTAALAARGVTLASANDWTKDFASVGLPELKHVFALHRASHQVSHRHFDFGHNFNQHTRAFVYESTARRFGLTVRDESTFEPIEPDQLQGNPPAVERTVERVLNDWPVQPAVRRRLPADTSVEDVCAEIMSRCYNDVEGTEDAST